MNHLNIHKRIVKYFGFILILAQSTYTYAQCPTVEAMMVDACNVEEWNEFVIINSGGGFNTNNISVDFDVANNGCASPGSQANNDINVNFNNCASNPNPCGLTNGNISAFSGCSNLISIGPGFMVPPNSIVILQLSSSSNIIGAYNMSSLCGAGQCVYVISSSCTRSSGALSNQPSTGLRNTTFDFGGGCSQTVTYDTDAPGFTNTNGWYFIPSSSSFVNIGCVAPPGLVAPPASNVNQPANVVVCGGEQVNVVFTGTATSYTWTNSNPAIGLGSSGTGDISYVAPNVTSTQVGTITVTPVGPCPGPSRTFTITINPLDDPSFQFNNWCVGSPNGPINIVTPGGTFSFNPVPGDGATINPITGVISGAIGGTPYAVQYTTPAPCSATSIVFVSALLTLNASFTFNDFCFGQDNFGIPINGGGTFSFNPNPGGGVTIDPFTGEISNEVSGATYTVQYSIGGPCPSSTTETVNVLPTNVPVLPSLGPYCTNSPSVNLPTIISGVTGMWSGVGVSGNVFSPATAGQGTFTLTFTPDVNQCASPATTSVTVNQVPTGNLIGSPTLCPGECGTVMFNFVGGNGIFNVGLTINAGPFNFSFNVPGATNATTLNICYSNALPPFNIATNTLNIPTLVPAGTYSLTLNSLTATAGPCPNGVVGTPGLISITLSGLPTATDVSASRCDLDQNGSEVFNLTSLQPSISSGANTFNWFTDMALTNPISDPNNFSATNGTKVYVRVTNAAGCEDVAEVTLNVTDPTILTLNDFALCVNDPLLNLPLNVGGFAGNWSGSNVVNGGSQFNPSGLPPGNYPITFNPGPGLCAVPLTVDVVISNGAPIPITDPIVTVCLGDGNQVLPTSIGGINGTWSGNINLSGNVFNVSTSGVGSFQVTFTPLNGCFSPNQTNIVVNPNIVLTTITFTSVCVGAPVVVLPNSVDGFQGAWSGSQVVNNTFNPNISPGSYPLTFTPIDPCAVGFSSPITVNAVATLTAPNLGPTCITGATIALPTSISGVNGAWTFNSTPISNFNPATFGQGSFILNFTPVATACAAPTSTTIVVNQISAGTDNSREICASDATVFNLNTLLSSGANSGGVWKLNNSVVSTPQAYDLSLLNPGTHIFEYQIINTLCGNDTSLVTFNIGAVNNAGNDGLLTLCSISTSSVNFSNLLGTFETGGLWTQPLGVSLDLTNLNQVNMTSLTQGVYDFKYLIPADICKADSSILKFDLKTYQSAGDNVSSTICLGSTINLLDIVNTSFTGGNILNPNNLTGLTNSLWNSSGFTENTYLFNYETISASPCPRDTAILSVTLASSLNAGNDVVASFCEGSILFLNDYLSSNASIGGTFSIGGLPISGNTFDPQNLTSFTIDYEVGDNVTCPKDVSTLQFSKVTKPVNTIVLTSDICQDKCENFTVNINASVGSTVYLSIKNALGQTFRHSVNIGTPNVFSVNICAKQTGPFDFFNLALDQSFDLSIDSIKIANSFCTFTESIKSAFKTSKSPSRQINRNLCKGQTLQVGQDVYTELKPTGTTIIPSTNTNNCDSTISVNLNFFDPSPLTNIVRTTCDDNFTLVVGTRTFRKSDPKGSVPLKNIRGCDSIVNVDLKFSTFSSGTFNDKTCLNDYQYTSGNTIINLDKANPTKQFTITGGSVLGCDSVVTINIEFLQPATFNFTETTCDETFTYLNFNKNNPTGSIELKGMAKNGCDSTIFVQLNFKSKPVGKFEFSTCDPAFNIKKGDQNFNKSNPQGRAILAGLAQNGCDSLLDVNLQFASFEIEDTLMVDCKNDKSTFSILQANLPGPYKLKVDNLQERVVEMLPLTVDFLPGDHTVLLENSFGCVSTMQISVDAISKPEVSLSQVPNPDGSIQIITLSSALSELYNFKWTPPQFLSCNDCSDPVANPPVTTEYVMQYDYGGNCTDTLKTRIFRKVVEVIIPNIFSPNKDGQNEVFFVKLPDDVVGVVSQMSIYDRWGNLVFNKNNVPANDPSVGWDGTFNKVDLTPGVYPYVIKILIAGKTEAEILSGSLTLLR